MKLVAKIFVACTFVFFSNAVFSQNTGDTITIKLFDYSSLNRDTVVDFSSLTGLTFEKVLMQYNMRCHGAGVNTSGGNNNGPNGSNACGEWDYSCNTYLHDSSRVDSVLNTHATHLITGFSGTSFNYSNQPTYNSYMYLQQEVTLNNIISENQSTIGNSGTTISDALPTTEENAKSQYLFTATELLAAGVTLGNIDAITLNVLNGGGSTEFLRVKIKHTTKTQLDDTDPDLTGFDEVYFHNTNLVNGSNRIQFYNAFAWDGVSNIIVEFSFTNPTAGSTIEIDGETLAGNYGLLTQGDRNTVFNPANYAEGTNYKGVPGADPRTIEAWVNTSVSDKEILSWGQNATGEKWVFRLNGDGTIRVEVNGGFKYGTTQVNDGNWHHVACTFNGTNVTDVLFYVDGQLESTGGSQSTAVNTDTTDGINLRVSRGVNNRYFDGVIDEVRLWSSALSASEIQNWMYKSIDASHPNYSNLEAYFPMNEGVGGTIQDATSFGRDADFVNGQYWVRPHGEDLFKEFQMTSDRPQLTFCQGVYDVTVANDTVFDTIINPGNFVTTYQVLSQAGTLNNDIIDPLSVQELWEATSNNVYDENGALIQANAVGTDGTINIGTLDYYSRYPMKFELMSFVTPYGIGLDLGQDGKTWTFNMSDFMPILNGQKRITIERGGQWQEEMDIELNFIVGTPPHDVLEVQQIWRAESRSYTSILDDTYFANRDVATNPSATQFKIRSVITGHGQEGEFIPRDHYIDVNGGPNEYNWTVWKECAENPVYPQGGTWIYDRAGWCPGMATDIQESNITNYVTAGQPVNIDYGLQTASGNSNYIVNHQLVQYGAPNHTLDASVVEIPQPSNRVEFDRANSICHSPIVTIQNTGSTTLTSLTITYWVNDQSNAQTFNWTGSLDFMETEEVTLPSSNAMWSSINGIDNVFTVEVSSPNGGADEYSYNNRYNSDFSIPDVVPGELIVWFKTNSAPNESYYELVDEAGVVWLSRSGMAANTTYKDTVSLPIGCYSYKVYDTDDDGLSFFANNDGSGFTRFQKVNAGTVKLFGSDYGDGFVYNFTVDYPLSYEELYEIKEFNVYPNPTSDQLHIEMNGFTGEFQVSIIDIAGKQVFGNSYESSNKNFSETISVRDLPAGLYLVNIVNGNELMQQKIVVE